MKGFGASMMCDFWCLDEIHECIAERVCQMGLVKIEVLIALRIGL